MITKNDRQLLNHICEYGFITIKQAYLLAFPYMQNGYEYARQRLQKLVKEGKLKIINNTDLKLKLFIDIDSKKTTISEHKIYLMNFYCELIKNKAEVELFKPEKEWLNGKIRSDAFCIYKYGGYRFRLLVEVNKSNNKLNLQRYDEAEEEILSACGGKYPRIILIDDRTHKEYDTDKFEVVRLDYKLENFGEIFL